MKQLEQEELIKKVRLVEGVGLPGSGKSTCIKRVQDLNSNPSIKVLLRKNGETKPLDKVSLVTNKHLNLVFRNYIILSYLVIRPFYFYNVLKTLILFKFNRNFISVLRSLIEAQYCYSKYDIDKVKNKHIILDEGLVQYLGSLVVNVPEANKLPNELIKHTLKNYITGLIYFEININNTVNRIIERNDGKSRFDTMNYEDKIINLKRMEKVFLNCLRIAEELEIPVLKVYGENTIEYNATTILNYIQNDL